MEWIVTGMLCIAAGIAVALCSAREEHLRREILSEVKAMRAGVALLLREAERGSAKNELEAAQREMKLRQEGLANLMSYMGTPAKREEP